MELLKLEQVSIAYDNERDFAVEDVSFTVGEGEYICLMAGFSAILGAMSTPIFPNII